ncbi:MAG: type II secretion system F family protein [Sedimentisphaerales bacterium]|jgi:type IV pilus assembly protein PilC|nr:type II secretion system F family protein [Sedimentisphaerales bacterium]
MPVFEYIALDSKGAEVRSEIEALTDKDAITKIRSLGYFPTKVQPKGAAKAAPARAAARPRARRGANARVSVRLITEFCRQLSTLQDAGLPLLRSLRILEEQQRRGSFKRIIGYVADDIEGGSTLSEALAKYPRAFDRLMVSMVAAGEAGGVLDLILARIADFKEKSLKLKGRVKGALVYPVVVLTAAFLIVLGLMKFVIPQFQTVLTEMVGGQLNPITTAVLAISAWIASGRGLVVLLAIPFIIIVTLKVLKKFRPTKYVLDAITLSLPVVGQLAGKIVVSRWTRTLGTLIGAGVPILDAINVTRETAGNEVYAALLTKIHNSIRQGDTFAGPLRQSRVIDGIVANMVAVGEETGELDKMLLKVADNYDEQVDVLVGAMMSLLEPVLIIFLGGTVGVVVLAVFLPMIQVIQGLSSTSGG